VFARLETVDRIAKDLRGGRGGIISVAATPTLGSSLLAKSVVRFRKQHPETQIILRSREEGRGRLSSWRPDPPRHTL